MSHGQLSEFYWILLNRLLGCVIMAVSMAVSVNWGSLLRGSLKQETCHLASVVGAPDCWKLPYTSLNNCQYHLGVYRNA